MMKRFTVRLETVMTTQFGDLLRHWREARKVSQLDLGLEANVSARHISFLETGRARPSRAMVAQPGGRTRGAARLAQRDAARGGLRPEFSRPRPRRGRDGARSPRRSTGCSTGTCPTPRWCSTGAGRLCAPMPQPFDDACATGTFRKTSTLVEALLDENRLGRVIENWEENRAPFSSTACAPASAHLGGDAWLDEMGGPAGGPARRCRPRPHSRRPGRHRHPATAWARQCCHCSRH